MLSFFIFSYPLIFNLFSVFYSNGSRPGKRKNSMGRVCFFILLKRKYKKPILSLNFFQFKILIIFFSLALNTIVWACFAWGSIIDSRSITSSKFLEKYRKSLGIFQFFSEDNAKNRITARIILLITAPNIFIFDFYQIF